MSSERSQPPKKRRRLRYWVLSALIPIVVLGFVLWLTAGRLAGELASLLAERLGQDVEMTSLSWKLGTHIRFEGEGLVVRRQADEAAPPLVSVESFTLHSGFRDLFAKPRRIHRIELEGLRVHVPRGRSQGSERPARAKRRDTSGGESQPGTTPLVVGEVVAQHARVEIGSSKPGRAPRVFDIRELRLDSVALDRPVSFEALLKDPSPPGVVKTSGGFGPWNKSDPSQTPISGSYRFVNADLGTFRGIDGILASEGKYSGSLGSIAVKGEADIPDFSVDVGGQVVPLETTFDAEVGGKGGDVQLNRVDTRFLDSKLIATGEVVKPKGAKGRTVDLDVVSDGARVEDVLRFALKGEKPPLTGDIDLETRLVIPPGKRKVMSRLEADGEFEIREGQFTSLNVQKTLAKLSEITSRRTEGEPGSSLFSNLKGKYRLENAIVSFSELSFEVPGTAVELTGSYGLEDESLDFRGRVLLERSPSEMVGGKLSRWLKVLDPVLRQGEAGMVLPITITGTRKRPSFGVDLKSWGGGLLGL